MKLALLIASILDFVGLGITIYFMIMSKSFLSPHVTWWWLLLLIMYVLFVIAAWMSMAIPISSLPRQLLSYSILFGPPLFLVVLEINATLGYVISTFVQTLLVVTPIPILCIFALVRGQSKTGHIISRWTFAAICAMTILQPIVPGFMFLQSNNVTSAIMLTIFISAVSLGIVAAIKDRQRAIQIIAANIASTGMVLGFILVALLAWARASHLY